jgi:hypothetical protein
MYPRSKASAAPYSARASFSGHPNRGSAESRFCIAFHIPPKRSPTGRLQLLPAIVEADVYVGAGGRGVGVKVRVGFGLVGRGVGVKVRVGFGKVRVGVSVGKGVHVLVGFFVGVNGVGLSATGSCVVALYPPRRAIISGMLGKSVQKVNMPIKEAIKPIKLIISRHPKTVSLLFPLLSIAVIPQVLATGWGVVDRAKGATGRVWVGGRRRRPG